MKNQIKVLEASIKNAFKANKVLRADPGNSKRRKSLSIHDQLVIQQFEKIIERQEAEIEQLENQLKEALQED